MRAINSNSRKPDHTKQVQQTLTNIYQDGVDPIGYVDLDFLSKDDYWETIIQLHT